MSTLLDVSGLRAGYGHVPVLRDIELAVAENEVVGVLGANGAGKTTLLRALSGSLPHVEGEITFHGRSLNGAREWDRAAAGLVHVPEGRHVFGAMTVRENLEVAALLSQDPSRLDEVMELFPRLRERATQPAASLSGGEQQMLAIGRALMTGPGLLAIDEMSAGLAPIIVDQLVDGLAQLRGSGLAVLLVEQSPHFVVDLVDRVYLLEQGRIIEQGTLDELGGAERLAELYLGVR